MTFASEGRSLQAIWSTNFNKLKSDSYDLILVTVDCLTENATL